MASSMKSSSVKVMAGKDSSGLDHVINQEVKEILDSAETDTAEGQTTETLAQRIALAVFRYRRPVKGVQAWLNRFLGPLPKDAKIIEPTKENLSKAGNYWLFGFVTSIVAIVAIFGLAAVFPFLSVSPLSLVNDSVRHFAGNSMFGTVLIAVAGFYMFRFAFRFFALGSVPSEGRLVSRLAMAEEQWFRMGAENWTMRQRLQSCVLFGLVHIQNVIYPVTSLIVVGLLGGVFMTVYLWIYRKTGDYEKATLASTKLHAAHNYFSFAYIAIALVAKGVLFLLG